MATTVEGSYLLQVLAIPVPPERYKTLLRPYEAVSGEPMPLHVVVTNVGSRPFPGGTLTIEENEHGLGAVPIAHRRFTGKDGRPITIPALSLQETKAVSDEPVAFGIPGVAWLLLSAKDHDGKSVPLVSWLGADAPSERKELLMVIISRIELELLITLQGRQIP